MQAYSLSFPSDISAVDSSSHPVASLFYRPEAYQMPHSAFYHSLAPEPYGPARAENADWRATGILHDFNNLLAIILSHSTIALAKLPADHPAHRYVERSLRATKRAADLSSQLMVDLRSQQMPLPAIDLNQIIQETVDLLEPKLTPKATVHLQLNASLHRTHASISQVQQALMNLLLNAAEAIEEAIEDSPGRIMVSTGNLSVADLHASVGGHNLPADDYIYLQVIDTGIGMTQATLDHIFEPTFTTKPTGNGIGLTTTLAIVHAHQGAMRVLSTPGIGTTFQLFLPACVNIHCLSTLAH